MTFKFTTEDVEDGKKVPGEMAASPVIASHAGEENVKPARANEAADLLALNAGIGKRRMRKASHAENKEDVSKVGGFQKPEEGLNSATAIEIKDGRAVENGRAHREKRCRSLKLKLCLLTSIAMREF